MLVTILGIFATSLIGSLGVYQPGLKFLTLTGLILLSIIFLFVIIALIFKTTFNWNILYTISVALILVGLTYICVDSSLEIIEHGPLKCELCP